MKENVTLPTAKITVKLNIGFEMLHNQKQGLVALLADDNNKEAAERFHLDGILSLLDELQDQAAKQIGEKQVFKLEEDDDEDFTDFERPVTISPVYDSVAFTQGQIRAFDAYQHFLYYFDEAHFKAHSPIGSEHMTNHFIDKLAYYRNIKSPEKYNSIEVLVTWIQNMSFTYQDAMIGYMLKYHTGKGGGFRSWK